MTLRNMATSLALAAGSLLFVAQPALHAQDYGYGRPYDNRGYDNRGYSAPRYDRDERGDRERNYRYEREMAALQRDREELNRALYRHDYRAARREEREIAQRERRMEYEFGRGRERGYGYRDERNYRY